MINPVRLLASGERLPFPNEEAVHQVPVEFYVPQSNLRQMLVPFYTGQHTYRVSESVLVDLPPDTKRGAPVIIKLHVDRNKAMHWWYSVNGGDFVPAKALNDPWTTVLSSPAMKELMIIAVCCARICCARAKPNPVWKIEKRIFCVCWTSQ